jgi:hypothetical protein
LPKFCVSSEKGKNLMRSLLIHRRVRKWLTHLTEEDRRSLQKCFFRLRAGEWEGLGIRVKKLKGIPRPVHGASLLSARANRDLRVIFTIQPVWCNNESNPVGCREHLLIWDAGHHDPTIERSRRLNWDEPALETWQSLEEVAAHLDLSSPPDWPTLTWQDLAQAGDDATMLA